MYNEMFEVNREAIENGDYHQQREILKTEYRKRFCNSIIDIFMIVYTVKMYPNDDMSAFFKCGKYWMTLWFLIQLSVNLFGGFAALQASMFPRVLLNRFY
jgi:hypothetical protein